jgi:hypothetical protein
MKEFVLDVRHGAIRHIAEGMRAQSLSENVNQEAERVLGARQAWLEAVYDNDVRCRMVNRYIRDNDELGARYVHCHDDELIVNVVWWRSQSLQLQPSLAFLYGTPHDCHAFANVYLMSFVASGETKQQQLSYVLPQPAEMISPHLLLLLAHHWLERIGVGRVAGSGMERLIACKPTSLFYRSANGRMRVRVRFVCPSMSAQCCKQAMTRVRVERSGLGQSGAVAGYRLVFA